MKEQKEERNDGKISENISQRLEEVVTNLRGLHCKSRHKHGHLYTTGLSDWLHVCCTGCLAPPLSPCVLSCGILHPCGGAWDSYDLCQFTFSLAWKMWIGLYPKHFGVCATHLEWWKSSCPACVCVCVHRRTGDEGKQTNTHKLSRALQPSLCGDGLHLHHVDPMPHSRSAPSPPHTVSSPLASSNWGLPELAGQQQLQQEDAFSWQRAVPLGARRRVHLCQNSTEASKSLKSSELFPVDHTAVLFWWGFYVSINIHGSST